MRLTTLLFLGAVLALSGCNTIAGVGEDISAGARALDRAF